MTHAELAAAGIEVTDPGHARLERFVCCLHEENQRLNLTGARTPAEIWRGHVCDSVALLPWLRSAGARRLLDLGSGGGLPGIPLACACDELQVTVLDATRKKVDAVRRMAEAVGLRSVQAIWGRGEALAHDPVHRERYDVVTARAVAALPVLIEYVAGFIRVGGHAWLYKSAAAARGEGTHAASSARSCNLVAVEGVTYRVPGDSEPRVLMGYRKAAPLPDNLPRASGRARKQPL